MENFAAAIPPNNRSIGEASDADAKRGLMHITETCVWEFFDLEFFVSREAMVIGRVEALGTGFPYVAWCLKYVNPFSMTLDWNEIKSVPGAIREARK